ncbi:MAG: MerR family transcriptional regulator [Anaerolineae bacterium]|nr:MerR family transcriptional regulator [Anaerolineae bacterium]MDK1081606.1 MerR family transcriptional regulator [Anaerolineae bacterium]MDK1117775.1 MerR family transcriptional regulator [Anaerolineae bacterium]
MHDLKQIGIVAEELGINPKTIRYYEERDLIPPAQRNQTGYRVYNQDDIERIAFILRSRDLDFPLDDIGEILALRENGEAPCLYVNELVGHRILDIDARISALQQLKGELEEIQKDSQALPRKNIVDKDCICQLIENQKLREQNIR